MSEIPHGYCHCGCGEQTTIAVKGHTAKGWVKGEPKRFVWGHHARKPGPEYVVDENGCWIWQKAVDRDGYGRATRGRRTTRAHRLFYVIHVGPIPRGRQLHHRCGVTACVNPEHLIPLTAAEHTWTKAVSKITPEQALEIRARVGSERTVDLAMEYGLSPSGVRHVVAGRSWTNVAVAA